MAWSHRSGFGILCVVLHYFGSPTQQHLCALVRAQTLPHRRVYEEKVCIILFAAMLIFAISIMVCRAFMYHNFFLMASKLLIEYSWLLCAIFLSLLIRLAGNQIKSGFSIYTPIMLMSFIVITFRIIFIPNNLVSLIFPPILLLFTLWQWRVVVRHNKNIPKSDIFYTWVSLTIMVVSTFAAWYGYTLLSVQILIWWMFQLACIQTITGLYDILAVYEERYLVRHIGENKMERLKWHTSTFSKPFVCVTKSTSTKHGSTIL